jgi:hypothetical protein
MQVVLDFSEMVVLVRSTAQPGLVALRETASPLGGDATSLVGEHVGHSSATWYLSILLTKFGDEVSAAINLQSNGQYSCVLTADVCLGPRVVFEQDHLFEAQERGASDVAERIESFLASFFVKAASAIASSMEALKAKT